MYITTITVDFNDTVSINNNCRNNDNNIETIISLLTIIQRSMSLMCLIYLMAYALIKPLVNKK